MLSIKQGETIIIRKLESNRKIVIWTTEEGYRKFIEACNEYLNSEEYKEYERKKWYGEDYKDSEWYREYLLKEEYGTTK